MAWRNTPSTYRLSVAVVPPPVGASGIAARITIVLALGPGFPHDTESPGDVSSTNALPEDSSSGVEFVGTGSPGVKERTVAPPPSVPPSASSVQKGVEAPAAAYASLAAGVKSASAANRR